MSPMDVLKPFLMLACVAFVTGFMGYLAMARLGAPDDAPAETWSSTVSAPADLDLNRGKLI
ncbi:hypothetical protein [uncultured Phenylobacterium sp.]|uniref:hypothetical protein n=1 Tax=uncultured Phenylobacterium sp. TaxID=349273 RepID=UPI0025E22F3B|nr:hypothetical protein [uncultured Phenylobacterium sp.]